MLKIVCNVSSFKTIFAGEEFLIWDAGSDLEKLVDLAIDKVLSSHSA